MAHNFISKHSNPSNNHTNSSKIQNRMKCLFLATILALNSSHSDATFEQQSGHQNIRTRTAINKTTEALGVPYDILAAQEQNLKADTPHLLRKRIRNENKEEGSKSDKQSGKSKSGKQIKKSKSGKNRRSKNGKKTTTTTTTVATVTAATTTTTTTIKPAPEECSGDERIPCSNGGYFVCLFDETKHEYSTKCSDHDSRSVNSLSNAFDYCGPCSISRQFIHTSFVAEIQPTNGTEYITSSNGDIVRTDHSATFNEFGFISLAASRDLITSISCANIVEFRGQMNIIFEGSIEPNLIKKMFPLGSLVVLDGTVFGSCDLGVAASENILSKPSLDGFLLVETVSATGTEVILSGEVGTIHYLFSNLSSSSSLLDSSVEIGNEIANEIGAEINFEFSFKEPEDSPIFLENKLSFTGRSFIELSKFDWSYFRRSFEISCDFGFFVEVGVSSKLIFQVEDKDEVNLFSKTFPSENPQDWEKAGFKIPIYNLAAAEAIEDIVNFFLPESQQINLSAGLSLAYPLFITLDAAQKLSLELSLGGIESKASTGKKKIRFRYSTDDGPSITMPENEQPSIGTTLTTIQNDGLDGISLERELTGFAGVQPQVLFETFGLATGSIGLNAGLFFDMKFTETEPYPPIEDFPGLPWLFGVCDRCHRVEMNLEAGVADPFLWYKVIKLAKKTDRTAIDLPQFKITRPLAHVCAFDGMCGEPALDIEVSDPIILGDGGIPNTLYSFTLRASNIPVSTVRFEWSPGVGKGDKFVSDVVDEEASTTIQVSYPKPGVFKLEVDVYDHDFIGIQPPILSKDLNVKIAGTTLDIDPPILEDGEVGVDYVFNLLADGIPSTVPTVEFTWSFGIGSAGTGSAAVEVIDGKATQPISHAYSSEGVFGIVADVRNVASNEVMAKSSAVATIGPYVERNITLNICDTWSATQSGGQGVTVDRWNISMIPAGAVFDVTYECFSKPDKILIEYPDFNVVLDTGWRGSQSYNGDILFPGGVISPGDDEVDDLFSRLTQDYFLVTVVGPVSGTKWNYQIRCRVQGSSSPGVDITSEVET